MNNNFKLLVYIAAVLQLMRMYDAATTGSNVVYTTNSVNQPTGGIAIDHPAQATIYAKRGKLNVLIPFEFTIIPLAQNSIEPEIPPRSSTPISGSIPSQQNSNYYRTNQDPYRPVYYQTSTYPWNNDNNRGFYIPASPPVSSSYQPFIKPTQQYQNEHRPIIYQQQLPPNTYRNQYYPPNSNAVYAPLYQQQPLRRTEVRPWPQYNRPGIPNQSQQQQQLPQPGHTNWSTNNTKPINISEMTSIHPPNTTTTTTTSAPSSNQTTSIATNSTISTTTTTEISPTTPVTTKLTETIPNAKEQPAVPTDAAMGNSNHTNSNDDTQKEKAKPIDGERIPVNQHGETNLDKKDSLPEVKSSVHQNSGEPAGGNNKVDNPESYHTDTAPAPIDNNNNNNNIGKSENTNHEQASVVNTN